MSNTERDNVVRESTRGTRTAQENAISFVRKLLKINKPRAWNISPEARAIVQGGVSDRLAVFLPCPKHAQTGLNIFGVRLHLYATEREKAVCPDCLSLSNTNARKLFDHARIVIDREPRIVRQNVSPVIPPGSGLLVVIPKNAGLVKIIVSGVYICVDDSRGMVEDRLPKNHACCAVTFESTDLPRGYVPRGMSIISHPHVLTQLTFKKPARLTLTVPDHVAEPYDMSDVTSRSGYVFSIVSSNEDYTVETINAVDCLNALVDIKPHGLKRARSSSVGSIDDALALPNDVMPDVDATSILSSSQRDRLAKIGDLIGRVAPAPSSMPRHVSVLPTFYFLRYHEINAIAVCDSQSHMPCLIQCSHIDRRLIVQTPNGKYLCAVNPVAIHDTSDVPFTIETLSRMDNSGMSDNFHLTAFEIIVEVDQLSAMTFIDEDEIASLANVAPAGSFGFY
jgi:hypothetical protein